MAANGRSKDEAKIPWRRTRSKASVLECGLVGVDREETCHATTA